MTSNWDIYTGNPSSWPGLLYGPETSPTGVRGHDRHVIVAWNRLGRPSMPWREVSVVDERREFVRLALQEGVNRRGLVRPVWAHPDIGYKRLGGMGCWGGI